MKRSSLAIHKMFDKCRIFKYSSPGLVHQLREGENMNGTPLTKKTHLQIPELANTKFAETPDALSSQFMARKPVGRFVVPRSQKDDTRPILATLSKSMASATVAPATITFEGKQVLFTVVNIIG